LCQALEGLGQWVEGEDLVVHPGAGAGASCDVSP